jgi:hypothetical protein
VPQESAAGAHVMAPIGRQHDNGARPGAWAVGFSFTEKLVVVGARLRNESAAQESTRGFRSAPPADRPERKGHPSEAFRELFFMSARQKRPKTAVDQRLSILFRNTRDLELQLFELNKLRYQVRQAELLARNRARSHSGARRPNPDQRPS